MSIVLAKLPKQQQNNFLSGWTLFILGSVELRADEWPELWQWGGGVGNWLTEVAPPLWWEKNKKPLPP